MGFGLRLTAQPTRLSISNTQTMDFNKRIPVIYTYFPKNSGQKKVPDNQQKIRIKCIAKKRCRHQGRQGSVKMDSLSRRIRTEILFHIEHLGRENSSPFRFQDIHHDFGRIAIGKERIDFDLLERTGKLA